MDFSLSKQEQLFLQMIREFAEKEVKPLAAEVDESERFPMETVQKMAKLGIMGIPFPVELGGAGGSNILYTMAVEELSRVCATTGVIVSAHTSLCCAPIMEHGTPEQKAKYLPKLASGEWIGAFGLTEPNAGTDASAQQTIAVKEGDHYVLNGSKIFITNAGYAHVYIIMAMTDKSKGTKGISAFIVDMKQEGVSCGKPEKKMGVVGCATSDIILENVRVHKDNLLGQEGKGFINAMKTLDTGRMGVAAQSIGVAQGCLDEAIKYAKERKQFGRPIAKFQAIAFMIAEMATKLEAAKNLVYKTAWLIDNGQDASMAASMAKFYASEVCNEIAAKTVQIHGGYGFIKDYKIERMFRDCRVFTIYEGTSQVQQMVISGKLLK